MLVKPAGSRYHGRDTLQTYRLCASLGILTRDFGDDCVLYLSSARETHLVNAAAAQVFALIEEAPCSPDALAEAMQAYLEDANATQVSTLVHEVVTGLSRIGVIEAFEDAS